MKSFAFLLCFFSASVTIAQSLESTIKDVQLKKTTKNQSFEYVEGSECLIRFTIFDTDDEEETIFELNLADLNANTVSFDTKGNEVTVEASTRGKRDLIKVYEDGEVEGFDDEMEVYAAGIEEAREIVSALRSAIETCSENSSENNYGEFTSDELQAKLENNITDVDINDEAYLQSISKAPQQKNVFLFEFTDQEEGEVMEYYFNPADLDADKVAFDTDDAAVVLQLETNNGDELIKVVENGETDGYTDKLEMMMQDLEQARDMVYLWQAFIGKFENNTVGFIEGVKEATLEQTIGYIPRNVVEVAVNEDVFNQKITIEKNSGFGYLLDLEIDEVSEGETDRYLWNMADVEPNDIEFDISGSLVSVVLPIDDKRDLVQHWEDGEMEGFEDEVKIYVNTLEDAKSLVNAFRHFAGILIKQDDTPGLPESTDALADYLEENITEVNVDDDRYQQTFEIREGNACLGLFELVDDDDEMIYEWNFTDLDRKKIEFDTKGDEIVITVETSGSRELIEVRENGEVEDYENEFVIRANTIEEARSIVEGIREMIVQCKAN